MSDSDYYKKKYAKERVTRSKVEGLIIKDLRDIFPLVTWEEGFGTGNSEIIHGEHAKNTPDIFGLVNGVVFCAIEVTGTDKDAWPTVCWLRVGKMRYAVELEYPVAIIFDINGTKRFVTLESMLTNAQRKTVSIGDVGSLDPKHTQPYTDLFFWIRGLLNAELMEKAAQPQTGGC